MIGPVACLIAFIMCALAGRRSIGHGLSVLIPIGFIYGYFRLMVLDGASHFLFDAGLVGLYIGHFTTTPAPEEYKASNTAMQWALVLATWPMICMCYSPMVESQPLLIQFVGLRANVIMIPMVVIGARMKREDFDYAVPILAMCCIAACAFGIMQYVLGVETFIPRNTASFAIYNARDLVGYVRVPSMFLSAHAFGFTMAATIPILLNSIEGKSTIRRALAIVAMLAASLGVFVSATRMPVIALAMIGACVAMGAGKRMASLSLIVVTIGILALTIQDEERLQRFTTLSDTDMIAERVISSVNSSFFDLLQEYPFGAGLARAFGTSIPYFLQHDALPQIGLESEWAHVLVEQGLVGFVGWAAFAAASVVQAFRAKNEQLTKTGLRATLGIVAACWLIAFIGAGMLYSVPSSAFILLYMGLVHRTAPEPKTEVVASLRRPAMAQAAAA